MRKKIIISFLFYCCICSNILMAQQVTQMEYFIDEDPGVGMATAVNGFAQGADVQHTFSADLTGKSIGFHQLYVRSKDTNGNWSAAARRVFYLSAPISAASNIVQMEYFINSDPGAGLGTPITGFNSGTDVQYSFSADLTGKPSGFYELYVRSKDTNGNWSAAARRVFYISAPISAASNIVQMEYFINSDPGAGLGTPISGFNNGTDVQYSFSADLTGKPSGFYEIYVRSKDTNGNWSAAARRVFYISAPISAASNIVQMEYFINSDPGAGLGTPISGFNNGTDVQYSFSADLTAKPSGFYEIYVRSKDTNDNWSAAARRVFYIEPAPTAIAQITQIEYFFNTDPGFGSATQAAVTPNVNISNANIPVCLAGVSLGANKFYARSKDANGKWSATAVKDVTITPLTPVSMTLSGNATICPTKSTTLSVAFANGQAPYSFSYSDGSNTYSVTTSTNPHLITVTPSVTTTYNLITTPSTTCGAVLLGNVTVQISSLPIANAGPDVSITCVNPSQTLTASGGTSYVWSNGANSAATTVSPINLTTYIVTVTNVAGCSATDAVNVFYNKIPPIANAGADITTACGVTSIDITASGGVGYQWSTGATTATATFTQTVATTYTVTVTAANGCTATDNVTITPSTVCTRLSAKIFLSSYNTSTLLMEGYLRTLPTFPLSDPYNVAPLNSKFIHVNNPTVAMTTASVLAQANGNAIEDWIFIELRTGTSNASTVAYTRSALVQRDGDVVDMDGLSLVSFQNLPDGDYYVSIRHRNHLGFRTLNKVAFSVANITSLDFSNNSLSYVSPCPLFTININLNTMIGGDGNSDGSVDALDQKIWNDTLGLFDLYQLNADYNLDGSVDAIDSVMLEMNSGKYEELD
jgi:hypothetical protein